MSGFARREVELPGFGGPMPVVAADPTGPAMLPQPESWEWFQSVAVSPAQCHR